MLTLRGGRISDVTAFIARSAAPRPDEEPANFPDLAPDERRVALCFERFGLPARLDP